jgi:hypothetical protein
MKLATVALIAVSASLAAGCADYYGYGPSSGYANVDYGGYYDDFYGPFAGGYWGPRGDFYYSDRRGHYHRDRGHHFRRDGAPGYHSIHGHAPPAVRGRFPHFGR